MPPPLLHCESSPHSLPVLGSRSLPQGTVSCQSVFLILPNSSPVPSSSFQYSWGILLFHSCLIIPFCTPKCSDFSLLHHNSTGYPLTHKPARVAELQVNFGLRILIFKFHVIFTRHKILSFFRLFRASKKMKTKTNLTQGLYKNTWWAAFDLQVVVS